MSRDFALILTAGGQSTRFGGGKKEYIEIEGETIIRRSLRPFLSLPYLKRVVVTYPKGQREEMVRALGKVSNHIPLSFVEGGETRTLSVKNGVSFLSSFSDYSLIAVHDGARPFVSVDTIERCLSAAEVTGGAVPALKFPDAVKRCSAEGEIIESVDRSGLLRVQTPQVFSRDDLISAYASLSEKESYDDDASLFLSRGGRVKAVEGNEENIKITWKSDLKKERDMRIGFGNDIHRLVENRPLMMGGIALPHTKGEEAHSDGDVLLHALIDALLGAAAKGDIGCFFPPEDKKWKDKDSKELLATVLSILEAEIINIDAVITLEGFRLKPYTAAIRESLSTLLSLPVDRISVKAKTNEGLDSLGKGEAVKAEVVVLVK